MPDGKETITESSNTNCLQKIDPSLRQASVNCLNRVVSVGATLASNLIIANLGADELAALTYISSFQTLSLVCLTSSLSVAGGMMTRISIRNPRDKNIKNIIREAQLLGLLESIPLMILLYSSGELLGLLKVDEKIANQTFQYFLFQAASLPLLTSFLPSAQLFIGTDGKTYAIASNILLSAAQVGLAYCLAFGEFGFPNLGIRGVGLPYLLKNLVQFFLNESYLCWRKQAGGIRLCFGNRYRGFLWSKGWPVGMQYTLELLGVLITSLMTGFLGVTALRIRGVVSPCVMFLSPLIFALTQSTTYVVGRARGLIDSGSLTYKDIRTTSYKNIAIAITVVGSLLVAMAINTDWYIRIFRGYEYGFTDAQRDEMRILILLICGSQVIDANRNICSGALKALYNTRFSAATSVFFRLFLKESLSLLFGFQLRQGLEGFAYANIITLAIASLTMLFYLHYSTTENHWTLSNEERAPVGFFSEVRQEFMGLFHYGGSFFSRSVLPCSKRGTTYEKLSDDATIYEMSTQSTNTTMSQE